MARTVRGMHDATVVARVARERRSIRSYEDRPLSRELVRDLVDLATRAPSNFNSQPWRFVVADSSEARGRIVALVEERLERAQRNRSSIELSHVVDHIAAWLGPLRESPVVVLAFYRRNPHVIERGLAQIPGSGSVLDYNPNLLSLGMALQNLLLDVHARGLGACTLAGPVPFLRGCANRFLGLSTQLELAAVVSIGHPSEEPPAPAHRRLDRVLSFIENADGEVRLTP